MGILKLERRYAGDYEVRGGNGTTGRRKEGGGTRCCRSGVGKAEGKGMETEERRRGRGREKEKKRVRE